MKTEDYYESEPDPLASFRNSYCTGYLETDNIKPFDKDIDLEQSRNQQTMIEKQRSIRNQ